MANHWVVQSKVFRPLVARVILDPSPSQHSQSFEFKHQVAKSLLLSFYPPLPSNKGVIGLWARKSCPFPESWKEAPHLSLEQVTCQKADSESVKVTCLPVNGLCFLCSSLECSDFYLFGVIRPAYPSEYKRPSEALQDLPYTFLNNVLFKLFHHKVNEMP